MSDKPAQDSFLLFVYGTLLKDGENHIQMFGAVFHASGETEPRYTLYALHGGKYPGMGEGGNTAVQGELYWVSPQLLAHLIKFEGEEYELTDVRVSGGWAKTFVCKEPPLGAPKIESGKWKDLLPAD